MFWGTTKEKIKLRDSPKTPSSSPTYLLLMKKDLTIMVSNYFPLSLSIPISCKVVSLCGLVSVFLFLFFSHYQSEKKSGLQAP